jgi:hypothetical protein
MLVRTNLANAVLTGCRVYGISAWDVKVSKETKQQDLVITPLGEPEVRADDLEVAQFIYLLLHNEKLQRVIETITSKVALILGRFSPQRKEVLDALRDELRKPNRQASLAASTACRIISTQDNPEPPFRKPANCLKSSDDGHLTGTGEAELCEL